MDSSTSSALNAASSWSSVQRRTSPGLDLHVPLFFASVIHTAHGRPPRSSRERTSAKVDPFAARASLPVQTAYFACVQHSATGAFAPLLPGRRWCDKILGLAWRGTSHHFVGPEARLCFGLRSFKAPPMPPFSRVLLASALLLAALCIPGSPGSPRTASAQDNQGGTSTRQETSTRQGNEYAPGEEAPPQEYAGIAPRATPTRMSTRGALTDFRPTLGCPWFMGDDLRTARCSGFRTRTRSARTSRLT